MSEADMAALHELDRRRRPPRSSGAATLQQTGMDTNKHSTRPGDAYQPPLEHELYSDLDSRSPSLKCVNVTMRPTDRIYLPWGTYHRGITGQAKSVNVANRDLCGVLVHLAHVCLHIRVVDNVLLRMLPLCVSSD
jgi:hypothetical protein